MTLRVRVCGAREHLAARLQGWRPAFEAAGFALDAVDVADWRGRVESLLAADVLLVLADAHGGLSLPALPDVPLAGLLGVRQCVLVVDALDRVPDAPAVFKRLVAQFQSWAGEWGLDACAAVAAAPVAGLAGPTLLQVLGGCTPEAERLLALPLRLPLHAVGPHAPGGRACSGRIASGRVAVGERLRVQPAGHLCRVVGIEPAGDSDGRARAGPEVTLTLEGAPAIAAGDLLSTAAAAAEVADQFECTLVWLADDPLLPGRGYRLELATATTGASVTELKYRLDLGTRAHAAARTLGAGEVAVCNIELARALPFDAGRDCRATGSFRLIDATSGAAVGAGLLHFALRRAHNIQPQALSVGKAARARRLGQQPTVLWFTGLSGAGKSTIADRVEQRLHALGRHCMLLDGDNLRHGLNRDLGFSDADRVENIRRVAEVARLMVEAGLIVITAFISPFRAERRLARARVQPGEFVEIHVDVPLAVAEQRDPKGLYAKARRGELARFTGIDSPYEVPETPELRIDTTACDADLAAARVIEWLHEQGRLAAP